MEIYKIIVDKSQISFELSQVSHVPESVASATFQPSSPNLAIQCRMGDPDLLQCVVWREEGNPGGYFAIFEKKKLLFVAIAATGIERALALGYFGALVANARYGVDVFENMEEPDD